MLRGWGRREEGGEGGALGRCPEIFSESPLWKPRRHNTADQLPVEEKSNAVTFSVSVQHAEFSIAYNAVSF